MSGLIVCKFGGSSVAYPGFVNTLDRMLSDDLRREIVVVSAPGKYDKNDIKVTDMLIELARTKDDSLLEKIIGRYQPICPGNDLSDIRAMLKERVENKGPDKLAYLDSIKAFGEEACARLLAERTGGVYVDPKELFVVSDDFGNAKILSVSEEKIRKRYEEGTNGLLVVPGFFGYTADGRIATFSRGGSDLTQTKIGAVLQADVCENYTDRDGVYAADPRIVKDPVKLDELTDDEMRDLSYSGFEIFHSEAMIPVAEKRIPVHIRNTFTYPKEGTYIVYDRVSDVRKPIVGVAYQNGFGSFNITKTGLNDINGVLGAITNFFNGQKLYPEHILTGVDDVSVVIKQDKLKTEFNSIQQVETGIKDLIGEGTQVTFRENVGCMVVAGKGMKHNNEISALTELELAKAGIETVFKSQGSEKRCIIYGINCLYGYKAVNLIYDKFIR